MVGWHIADIADTLHQRDVAMATTFWLSMGYNFSCMIASGTIFDSRGWVFRVNLFNEVIADFKVLRDVAMATIFCLAIYGVHIGATWQIRLNRPCAAAMRPYVKLLWPLVVVVFHWVLYHTWFVGFRGYFLYWSRRMLPMKLLMQFWPIRRCCVFLGSLTWLLCWRGRSCVSGICVEIACWMPKKFWV